MLHNSGLNAVRSLSWQGVCMLSFLFCSKIKSCDVWKCAVVQYSHTQITFLARNASVNNWCCTKNKLVKLQGSCSPSLRLKRTFQLKQQLWTKEWSSPWQMLLPFSVFLAEWITVCRNTEVHLWVVLSATGFQLATRLNLHPQTQCKKVYWGRSVFFFVQIACSAQVYLFLR